ncbi:DMT family transporter [Candidatus Uhrbacteria bacterium]|nr:DMT family transporter [Candidatus Uhrbacteria bacterium]
MSAFITFVRAGQQPILLGILASALAATSYGVAQFLARKLVVGQAPALVVTTFSLVAGMVILGVLSGRGMAQDRHAPRRDFLFMAIAGLLASGGVAAMFYALSMAPLVVVSPIAAVNPLVSLALAHFFLQRLEKVTLRIWIGAGLVVAGVVLVTLGAS